MIVDIAVSLFGLFAIVAIVVVVDDFVGPARPLLVAPDRPSPTPP